MTTSIAVQVRHRHVMVDGLDLHVAEAGTTTGNDFLLLHGWPEDWTLYERVLKFVAPQARAVAIDLPGIGASAAIPPTGAKRWLAARVPTLIRALDLTNVTLVGHDVGGQIAYACLRICPTAIARVVLMNIVIPGIDPWDQVIRNPHLWHFAFHAVPDLPETLVAGHTAAYFDFFFDALAGPRGVSVDERARYVSAYARRSALETGFSWYRAFAEDEKANRADHGRPIEIPVLCLRGDKETGKISDYGAGLRRAGCAHVESKLIADCGHFAPSEQPEQVAQALQRFGHAIS